jgi:hypothetical protein
LSKRFFVFLLGCLLITSATFANGVFDHHGSSVQGSNEYFGAAKNIDVPSVQFVNSVEYGINSTVKFTLPANFKFADSNYLIGYWDTVNGVTNPAFAYTSGIGTNELVFTITTQMITPVAGGYYFLANTACPGPGAPPTNSLILKITVPKQAVQGTEAAWTDGADFKLLVRAYTSGLVLIEGAIITSADAFLTLYDEFRVTNAIVPDTSKQVIDFNPPQLRKQFVGPSITSRLNFQIERNNGKLGGSIYVAGPILAAGDLFVVTAGAVDSNYVGIASVGVIVGGVPLGAAAVPGDANFGPHTTFEIPGNTPSLFDPLAPIPYNAVVYTVTGTDILDARVFDFKLAFIPDPTRSASTKLNGFTYASPTSFFGNSTPVWLSAWDWTLGGTVFRSQWAVSASNDGYNSGLRIGNYGRLAAPVYADIWLDSGAVATNVLLTDGAGIAGGSFLSISFVQICDKAVLATPGFVYSKIWGDPSAKGRIKISVLGKSSEIFGYLQYATPLGVTTVTLEKQ